MVLLNPFQATLYRQISATYRPLDEIMEELICRYQDHPSIWSDLLYLLGNISVSNTEARHYFGLLENHRLDMERALGYPIDLRVALINYFTHIQPKYASPKIVEIKEYQESMSLAMLDGLTGLLNRRSIEQILGNEIARSNRHKHVFSVFFADVDNFKQINDNYGHHIGDEILQAFGQFFKAHARSEDIASRWGGEEFVMLLPQTDSLGVERVAERLLHAVRRTGFPSGISITFSAGVAEFPRDGRTAEALVSIADERMYRAKSLGRDRICIDALSVVSVDGKSPAIGTLPFSGGTLTINR